MYKHVASIVISFHLLFMALLLFNPHRTPIKRTTHVKVRTVRPLATIKQIPRAAPKKAPVQKNTTTSKKPTPSQTLPKPQPTPKKTATSNKPAIIEKNKPVKKTPPPKKETPKKMWDEIDQALAKIEKKSYPASKQPLEVPKSPTFLDELPSVEEGDNKTSYLMGYLHDMLHLPEVGEVKVEITVRKNGTVAKVVVLHAASQKNKLYLEEHLPLLQMPFEFEQEKTWTITFCNEI
jgi:outer membrane biosynthesis protein TonB